MVNPSIIYWLWSILVLLFVSCGAKTQTFDSQSEVVVHQISKNYTNIYLLEKDGRTVMIDAGYSKDSTAIEKSILKLGVDPYTIEYLILTHGHSDHAGSAAFFKNKYKCKIIAGQGDVNWIESGKHGHLCPTSTMAKLMKRTIDPTFTPVHVEIPIIEGSPLQLDHWQLMIEVLPGHTAGSLIIHGEYEVFVGDLIRGRPLQKENASRHYFMCDVKDNDDDIKALLAKTGNKVWHLGHFGPLSREEVSRFLND